MTPRTPRSAIAQPARRVLITQGAAAAATLALPRLALAAPGGLPDATHTSSSPEWERLAAKLFPGRTPVAGRDVVALEAPLRAAYGASVPVKVTAQLPQTGARALVKLTLVIDQNPSPLAAVIALTPALGRVAFETRMRVDTYSHVRAIAELANGELHTDSRFVKTSGGCSAPPNREALHLIGKTVIKHEGPLRAGEPSTAEVTVVHPNDTGFEMNHVTVMTIPPHFVRRIRMSYDGRLLWDADMDFSFSENPTLRFAFVPPGPGELRAEAEDTKDNRYEGRLRLA